MQPTDILSSLSLRNLRCEYKVNPLGIDVRRPRLSWEIVSPERGVIQTAYQIQVTESAKALAQGQGLLWDSGKTASDQSIHRVYEGPDLRSGQRCYWQVRLWDGADRVSAWSEPAFWEMGLLDPADWQAQWIQPDLAEDTATSQPCPMLRRTFTVDAAIKSARAYVTSLGLYELTLNGRRVGDQVLTPGWTSYHKRLQYQTYDVGDLLRPGENAVGVTLADGWYRGFIGFEGQRNFYGDKLALLLQIRIVYADGREQIVGSDESWQATTGPIRMADIYNGETYDARLEMPGWNAAGYECAASPRDTSGWAGVRVIERSKAILVAPAGPPVRRIEEIRPVAIIHTPAGETVFDMGQNMVGWIRLRVKGDAGTTVTLRHAEVLDRQGNFYTANLRSAKQTVRYTLKGGGEEVYEPRFTFQGFRYVAVEGYPAEPTLDSLTGIVVHSDTPATGRFECSNPLINQLQHNIVWGQKGNFVDVPTDCPQRDERLGWTGDAQVFIRTACFNMDVAAFFTKWLRDLAADQAQNGSIPFVIPDVLGRTGMGGQGSSAWGDAGTICPWTIYLCYGDTRILATQYESMKGWVEFIRSRAGDSYLWNTGFHFGDWLAIASPNPLMPASITDVDLISTAFFAYSTAIVARTARVLGKEADAREYEELLARIKEAFCREFITPGGRLGSNTQTAYALALMFDLLPEAQRPPAAKRLADDIRKRGNHISSGFVGTSYLPHVLTRYGYLDTAYALLNQDTYPSWLYPIKLGATTIWERWDGIKPNGEFQDAGMNSFNHYAYGAIGEWLYRVVAGIEVDPDAAGYKHILLQPQPGGGLTRVAATLRSMHGEIGSEWELADGRFRLIATVPANTTATVRLPQAKLADVTEGGQAIARTAGVKCAYQDGDAVVVETGSGRYEFSYPAPVLAAHSRPRLTMDSKVRDLIGDEKARAILEKHAAGAISSPQLDRALEFTLTQVAAFVPHVFTPEVLEAIGRDLAELG